MIRNIYEVARISPKQVGNPTSTTSHLKRHETKDAQGSAHFYLFCFVVLLQCVPQGHDVFANLLAQFLQVTIIIRSHDPRS
jgi:hypothetical protein